jgi:hypothetical protein
MAGSRAPRAQLRQHVRPRGSPGCRSARRAARAGPVRRQRARNADPADTTRPPLAGRSCIRLGSGRGIRTPDLRVMSPTSYRCSIPRRPTEPQKRLRHCAPLGHHRRVEAARRAVAPAHRILREPEIPSVSESPHQQIEDVLDRGSSPRPLVPVSSTHCCASTSGLSNQ